MTNIIATSSSVINGDVYIPFGTQNGLYNVNAYNYTDGIMTMNNAFSVAATNAQIITVAPNNGNQGQILNLSLSCQNASFSSGTNTQVWFSQGSYTMMGTNTTIINNNIINTDLYINPNAPLGIYNSLSSNSIDGTLIKYSSFTVNNYNPSASNIYPNFSKPGKNIDIYIPFSILNNISLSNAIFYYQRNSDIIPITFDNTIAPFYGIYANAIIPSNVAIGCYNLMISSTSGINAFPCALELVGSNQASIDSAVVDIDNVNILNIYGDKTHFTSNSLVVNFESPILSNNIDSIIVINDIHIKVFGVFSINVVKTASLFEAWVNVYNSIDNTLTYPFKALLFGSISDLNTFNNIRYFPNPTTDIVRIQSDEFKGNIILAEVYSPDGKLILSRKFAKNEAVVIDLNEYSGGLYNIRISNSKKTKTLSVIKR